MKLNDIISEIYQRSGLWFINRIARSEAYSRLSDVSFGALPRQKLDYYQLKDNTDAPTVLFFYGGNWRSGAKADYRFVADTLLAQGFNVVVPDYRLYPNVRFGDIRSDAVAAFEKTCDLIPEGSPIYLMGHSAGAQIAALLTLDESLSKRGDRIQGMIGLSGPYDFFPFTEDDHWDLFSPAHLHVESQAVNFVRKNAAPMYLLHGEDDKRVRRGHSKSLMEKQIEAGGDAAREVYEGLGHVDVIIEFSRLHRGKSDLVKHIKTFIEMQSSIEATDRETSQASSFEASR